MTTLAALVAKLERLGDRAMTLASKNVAFAVESLVQEGFDTATDPYGQPWAPKKAGVGRPLQDTGELAASFHVARSGSDIICSSSNRKAAWHQYGTGIHGRGKGRYPIRPKTKKALAIPTEGKTFKISSLGKGIKALPGRRAHGGKVTRVALRKLVWHPGVQRRMMLPDGGRLSHHWAATIRRSIDAAVERALK